MGGVGLLRAFPLGGNSSRALWIYLFEPGYGCVFNMIILPNCCSRSTELLQQMLPSVGLLCGR